MSLSSLFILHLVIFKLITLLFLIIKVIIMIVVFTLLEIIRLLDWLFTIMRMPNYNFSYRNYTANYRCCKIIIKRKIYMKYNGWGLRGWIMQNARDACSERLRTFKELISDLKLSLSFSCDSTS